MTVCLFNLFLFILLLCAYENVCGFSSSYCWRSVLVSLQQRRRCATISAMIVASIFTCVAPLTFTVLQRSHPTVQDFASLPLKIVISRASELQDCIIFVQKVCLKKTKIFGVILLTESTILLSNFAARSWFKYLVQSELDETDRRLISLSSDSHLLDVRRLWHSRSRTVSSLMSRLGHVRLVCRSTLGAGIQGEEPVGRCGLSCCTGRCDVRWQCSHVSHKKGENTDGRHFFTPTVYKKFKTNNCAIQ